MNSTKTVNVKKAVVMAMLCAIAYLLTFVLHINVSFLTLDLKNAILVIASFMFGPVAGVIGAVVVTLLEFITISDTGVYGLIMNFSASASFSVVAGLFYRYRRTLGSAAVGLSVASVVMTAVMLLMNLLITPYYMGVDVAVVKDMILPLLLPFNLVKAALNSGVALLLYRPLSIMLKSAHLLPQGEIRRHSVAKTVAVSAAAAVIIAACVVVLIVLMSGSFKLV